MFLFIFGHRHMGACDYFHHNGGEYCVTARMAHCQFIPIGADGAMLRIPGMPGHGLSVSQVPGAADRCFRWALLRVLLAIASIILWIISFIMLHDPSQVILCVLMIIASIIVTGAAVWAFFKKPKCSHELAQLYLSVLRPRQHWPPIFSSNRTNGIDPGLTQDSFGQIQEVGPGIRMESLTVPKSSDSEGTIDPVHLSKNSGKKDALLIDISDTDNTKTFQENDASKTSKAPRSLIDD